MGGLARRCGVANRATREEFMMSLCKDGDKMRRQRRRRELPSAGRCGHRYLFSPASHRCCNRCSLGRAPCSKPLRVASRFWADATNQTMSPESPRARRQRLIPTRCYGSGAPPALPQPASLARGILARNQPTDHRQRHAFHHTPKRQMDNIMYLYEQLGPPDAPTRPQRRRIGGLVV